MTTNTMTLKGAERLARKINGYWADRGVAANARAERDPRGCNNQLRMAGYYVRSDLINGGPQVRRPSKSR